MSQPLDWRGERDKALLLLEREQRPSVRGEAAAELCELARAHPERAPELAPLAPGLLADAHPEVRRAGVALLALTFAPEELPSALAQRLGDPSPSVRVEAAGRLADLALPETRGSLASALGDGSFPVRFEAARGMAALRHAAGLEVLVEGLHQEDFRYRALGALAELGDARAVPAIRKVFEKWFLPPFERTQAAGALARLGQEDGGAYLVGRAEGKWSVDQGMAIELLGEAKVPGALERLVELARREDPATRGSALRGLGRLGDARATPLLEEVLADPDTPDDVRLDAAEGLLALGLEGSRARVERAMGLLKSGPAREELRSLLEETPG